MGENVLLHYWLRQERILLKTHYKGLSVALSNLGVFLHPPQLDGMLSIAVLPSSVKFNSSYFLHTQEERGTVRVLTCLTQEHCPVTPAMAQNQSASNTQFDAPTMMLLSVPPISPNTIRVKKKHTVSFLLFLSHLNDLF